MTDDERTRRIMEDLEKHGEWLRQTCPQLTGNGAIYDKEARQVVMRFQSAAPLSPAVEGAIREKFDGPYLITFGLGRPVFQAGG